VRLRFGLVLVLVLPALGIVAQAATIAKVKVPGEAAYLRWLSYMDANGAKQVAQPMRFHGPETIVEDGLALEKAKNIRLHVLNPRIGNEAVTNIEFKPDKPAEVKLTESSFKTVRQVQINIVSSKGKLVESALVTLTDANGDRQTQLVEPTTRGAATFFDVPSGAGSVKVIYGDGKSTLQDVEIPLDREQPVFVTEVPVAGEVATLKAAKPEQTTPARERRREPRVHVSALETLVATLIGVIILAGGVALLYIMLRARGITAKAALERLGAQLPGAADQQPRPQPTPVTPEGTCPFCGHKKDPITGACACTISPSAATTAGPRLVGMQGAYMGKIFDITGTEVTIGRGAENAVALVDDNTASRHHASIIIQSGAYSIRDMGSSNGTFVNGAKITEQALKPGDEVQVGSTRFRFEA